MATPIQLQPNEVVLEIVRRHPIYLSVKLLALGLLLAAVVFGLLFVNPDDAVLASALDLLFIALGIGVLSTMSYLWYRYRNDLWMITNQRLVDSVRYHPFHHQVSTTSLLNVEDIDVVVSGFLATTLNFGDVFCQTASPEGDFVFLKVQDPNAILQTIDGARRQLRSAV